MSISLPNNQVCNNCSIAVQCSPFVDQDQFFEVGVEVEFFSLPNYSPFYSSSKVKELPSRTPFPPIPKAVSRTHRASLGGLN